jgi:CRISPR-associated endonuclease Csy4
MTQVMEKLHQRFVQLKDGNNCIPLGISFPRYQMKPATLGDCVRIHGEEEALVQLEISALMASLDDYVHIAKPRPIPASKLKGYVSYARVRHDHGRGKLIRRKMKRHGLTEAEAMQAYAGYERRVFPDYPFVLMRSKSTGNQRYPFYLKQIEQDEPGEGIFNTFGVNVGNGVEWF